MPSYSPFSRAQSFSFSGFGNGRLPTTLDLAFETALLEHMPLLDDLRSFEYGNADSLSSETDQSALSGGEIASPHHLFTLMCVVFGIPAAHIIVACVPFALGWISAADILCYFTLMLTIGLVLDVVFLLTLLIQLLQGLNLRHAMPAALKGSIQAMSVLVLLGIYGCELWLLAQGGVSAGVAF